MNKENFIGQILWDRSLNEYIIIRVGTKYFYAITGTSEKELKFSIDTMGCKVYNGNVITVSEDYNKLKHDKEKSNLWVCVSNYFNCRNNKEKVITLDQLNRVYEILDEH